MKMLRRREAGKERQELSFGTASLRMIHDTKDTKSIEIIFLRETTSQMYCVLYVQTRTLNLLHYNLRWFRYLGYRVNEMKTSSILN